MSRHSSRNPISEKGVGWVALKLHFGRKVGNSSPGADSRGPAIPVVCVSLRRADVRDAELENRQRRKPFEGSNPSLSANLFLC